MFNYCEYYRFDGKFAFLSAIISSLQFNVRAQRSAIVSNCCPDFLLQTVSLRVASLTSSATFGALDIALRLCAFALCSLRACMTDTDDVALLELKVEVLLILHLRFR